MIAKRISIVFIAIYVVLNSCDMDSTANIGTYEVEIYHIESINNGKLYTAGVVIPSDYDNNAEPYPVLYTLDGEGLLWEFGEIIENQKKRVIIVALYNMGDINRSEDNGYPGVLSYTQLITDELAPIIEEQYNIDPNNRTLMGQSWTGVGVSFIAFLENNNERYFQRYIPIDPPYLDSVCTEINSLAVDLMQSTDSLPITMNIYAAEFGFYESCEVFYNQISGYDFDDYTVSYSRIPDTYHGGTVVNAVFQEFIQIYENN